MKVRILLADDHPIVLDGLRRMLASAEFEIIGAVTNGHDLVNAAVSLKPDVIICDITMPLLNGLEATRQIHARDSRAKVIILSMYPAALYAMEALKSGAKGYVVKSADTEELIMAIRRVNAGELYMPPASAESLPNGVLHRPGARWAGDKGDLTKRQYEVLQLLAEGKSVKEIAAVLNISDRTVEFHKYRLMGVLGIRTVAGLAAFAAKRGITG
jgi:DNA-binding NarL/FixJ family response regulator